MTNAKEFGTLFQSLERAIAKYGDRAAYAVPAMEGRAYHPQGKSWTWGETGQEVELRRRQYAAAGYGPGHRVAILFDQRPEFVFHHLALNALGCSTVPVSPDYRDEEIAYLLENSESCLVLAIPERLAQIQRVAQKLERPIPALVFDDLTAPLPAAPFPAGDVPLNASTEAAMLYTSGTTGRPKGCVLSNEYFHSFGMSFYGLGGRLTMREGEERLYNPLPLHHANCLSISLPAMLIAGGCLVFPDRFHASTFWRDIVECEITAIQFQGVIPNILLKLPVVPEERQHKVKFVLCAGVEPELHALFEERFGFPLVEMWAMTETGRIMSDYSEPRMIHTRAFGRPGPGLDVRIIDADHRETAVGVPGEFVIRHSEEEPRKGFFSEYLKNPEANDEAWRSGWFHTGDVAVRDESGMFFFLDRSKNIIRRAGENIAAAEVEACLATIDCIKQAAVLAVPDEVREEEVMACIVLKSPELASEALAREILERCCERLAYFKAPAFILFVTELPTGSSQKIQKIRLFPAGVDPRTEPGVFDLRSVKKKPRLNA